MQVQGNTKKGEVGTARKVSRKQGLNLARLRGSMTLTRHDIGILLNCFL